MSSFKYICVIGRIKDEKNTEFVPATNDLGKAIIARKINLVYGEGVRGLQGWVAVFAFKKFKDYLWC